jgi:hypothetical protein
MKKLMISRRPTTQYRARAHRENPFSLWAYPPMVVFYVTIKS